MSSTTEAHKNAGSDITGKSDVVLCLGAAEFGACLREGSLQFPCKRFILVSPVQKSDLSLGASDDSGGKGDG